MAEHEAHVTQIAAEKAMRTARLAIPNFHLAHPPVSRCEHVEVKFWGNKYCRGLRCVGCKMELTRSHEQMVRGFFCSLFFGVFLFFFALFIDLLTDKVQPLFKKAQIGTLSSEVEVMVQHHRHHEHGNYRSKDDKEYVKSVFIIHVGGTRCVTSSIENIMKIRARITLTVEFIRGYIFKFLFYV